MCHNSRGRDAWSSIWVQLFLLLSRIILNTLWGTLTQKWTMTEWNKPSHDWKWILSRVLLFLKKTFKRAAAETICCQLMLLFHQNCKNLSGYRCRKRAWSCHESKVCEVYHPAEDISKLLSLRGCEWDLFPNALPLTLKVTTETWTDCSLFIVEPPGIAFIYLSSKISQIKASTGGRTVTAKFSGQVKANKETCVRLSVCLSVCLSVSSCFQLTWAHVVVFLDGKYRHSYQEHCVFVCVMIIVGSSVTVTTAGHIWRSVRGKGFTLLLIPGDTRCCTPCPSDRG